MVNEIEQKIREAFRPAPQLGIVEWAERFFHVDQSSSMRGLWRSANSPWVIPILREFEKSTTRQIVVLAPSQSAKTQPAIIAQLWSVENAPGPSLYVTATDELGRKTSTERIAPSIAGCAPVNSLLLNNRFAEGIYETRFQNCTLTIASAKSQGSLESTAYRYIFADESRLWEEGRLSKLEKRQRTFPTSKRWIFTTPGDAGDELDMLWRESDCRLFHISCMKCNHEFAPKWQHIAWADSKLRREIADSVRLVCPACGHGHRDEPNTRLAFAGGRFVQTNPAALEGYVGFHYNFTIVNWIRWADVVWEWKRANDLMELGNIEALKVVINESFAEFWEIKREGETVQDLGHLFENFKKGIRMENGRPVLAVDVQKEKFYWTLVDFGAQAQRVVDWGTRLTFEELREVQQKYGVEDRFVVIDSGYDTNAVYRACLANNWIAMKGTDRHSFAHTVAGRTVNRIWYRTKADPGMGTGSQGRSWIPLYLFASDGAKNILSNFLARKVGHFELPSEVDDDFVRQATAEVRERTVTKSGREKYWWRHCRKDNHYFDCLVMTTVVAVAAGWIGGEEAAEAVPDGLTPPAE
jgi:phage terminase large subunit GpA-like protein